MIEIVKFAATGRRKTSIARVNIMPGAGNIIINNLPFDHYFSWERERNQIVEPLQLTRTKGKFDVNVKVTGGGTTGQAGAIRLGLARALVLSDPAHKEILKKSKFLTRDPRMKERKKPGQKGARKKFQWVKR